METFEIRNLTFSYPEQEKKALQDISFCVEQGEFLVLCGPSGCGKSTLLRQLKPVLAPHGQRSGSIFFEGTLLEETDERKQAAGIGFVQQSPDNQIVTDKVWHELAFGLESLGTDTPRIRQKVAEMASFFGIQEWFYKKVSDLSGGQKQLLNLASVMVMQPSVLILDEPTSQLDPIAASDFLATLGKINRELGTTILLTEHRLEEALPLADKVAIMEQGRLLCIDKPASAGAFLKEKGNAMFLAMPAAMRIWAALESEEPCPVTVREGRDFLERFSRTNVLKELEPEAVYDYPKEPVLTADNIWLKYEKDLPDVVKGLSLQLRRGEFLALLGGNGTGKTTSLKALAGLLKPYRGTVKHSGRIGFLPQNPQMLFVKKTVREDLFEVFSGEKTEKALQEKKIAAIVRLCRLEELLERHPFDLSGGEQQRAALAKTLLLEPEILFLDEPTKGFDAEFKQLFAEILRTLLRQGMGVLMVSHDVEFCALYAHRCTLFFDGNIVTEGTPRAFFSGNHFYTTAANRIARELIPEAITVQDVAEACGGSLPKNTSDKNISIYDVLKKEETLPQPREGSPNWKPKKLPWWRKTLAVLGGLAALIMFIQAIRVTDLTAFIDGGALTEGAGNQLWYSAVMVLGLLLASFAIGRRTKPPCDLQMPGRKRKLRRRTAFAAAVVLLCIPFTIFVGVYYLGNVKFYFIALLVLLECMLPFFLVFEGKKPQARELVTIASLCAIGVAGRALFFMLPGFKPVAAITILAGVALGGETGFLVGAVTMLLSNMMFSQGPLTPWQMFAMGLIGFFAGVLFGRGSLRRSRLSLCIFGTFSTILIYGGIMNPASALVWQRVLNKETLLAYYVSGFPFDCVHGAATAVFLWFGAEPILEKLERIKVKYGFSTE